MTVSLFLDGVVYGADSSKRECLRVPFGRGYERFSEIHDVNRFEYLLAEWHAVNFIASNDAESKGFRDRFCKWAIETKKRKLVAIDIDS